MNNKITNPAELASIQSLNKIQECINNQQSFKLEAGAGAGKTYSLIESLKYIINNKSDNLVDKRIACITYTNVAKEEILKRTDNHPLIYADTIHAFCWELIQPFQVILRSIIVDLSEKWRERISDISISNHQIKYDLGYSKLTDSEIFLHHDDVIKCMSKILQYPKFQKYIKSKFPIIFIDEYQDTDKDLAVNLINYLIENDSGILVGFFGDHWQKIYGKNACGLVSSSNNKIHEINKNANFRSDKNIVMCLNKIRAELPQNECDPSSKGTIKIYHSNNWSGNRQQGQHWKGDLPAEIANQYINHVRNKCSEDGWDMNPNKTKILFLTNNLIATESGYKNLADCFEYSDDYLKKGDPYIKFILDILEPCFMAFKEKKFGTFFQILGKKNPNLVCQGDKKKWVNHIEELIQLRMAGTIKDFIKLITEKNLIKLPESIESSELKIIKLLDNDSEIEITDKNNKFISKIIKLHNIDYKEVINLGEYIDEKTPFSTKHGVKGAEFDNVLVILGRGWNQYNWEQMLVWMKKGIPEGKEDTFERYRNLFYVCCSRSKHNLSLLFTQCLSEDALWMLEEIFSSNNIIGDPIN